MQEPALSQITEADHWLQRQEQLRLPVPYFLLTFTLPAGLREIARNHQKALYQLLFRSSAGATQQLARDPRLAGGQVGLIGVLQTWSRDLSYHPHVHYLVPGGAVAQDGRAWLPSKKSFFLPVKPLSILFRAKFRDSLRKTDWYAQVPGEVWRQDWVVHCQPVGTGVAALKYLAPYVFRVALTNRRIRKLREDRVTFEFGESHSGAMRTRTLPVEEFMRRFLQHVLPRGFVKVRYYGFLSAGKRQLLAAIRRLLGGLGLSTPLQDLARSAGLALRCPSCGSEMRWVAAVQSQCRPPPPGSSSAE